MPARFANPTASPRRNSRAKALPLECWFWAFVFVCVELIYVIVKIGGASSPDVHEFDVFNVRRVEQFAQNNAKRKVILFGTSRLKYSTGPEEGLVSAAAAKGVDAAFLTVVQNSAEFNDFHSLLEPIINLRPDIVVLQASLFVKDRTSNLDYRIIQKYALWALRGGEGPISVDGIDQKHVQFARPCTRDFSALSLDQRVERVSQRGIYDLDGENAAAVQDFIAAAREAGIRVVALDFPRTSALNDALRDFYGEKLIRNRILSDTENAWSYPGVIPDSDFCDATHMDENGRAVFSDWLIDKIIEELAVQSSSTSPVARTALNIIDNS